MRLNLFLLQEEELVDKYRKDSVNLREHIKTLSERPIEFRGTLCDTCNQPLTMPSLYFLCQHSYHQEYVLVFCLIMCELNEWKPIDLNTFEHF